RQRRWGARAFRRSSPHAVRKCALLRRMGGAGSGGSHHLYGLGGPARAMNWLDNNILTLVTFVPAIGAALLLFFPRRHRDIRLFALVVSLLSFVVSLHLPAHFNRN